MRGRAAGVVAGVVDRLARESEVQEAEARRLRLIAERNQSPEHYIRYQMMLAAPILDRIRAVLPTGRLRVLDAGCGTGGIGLYLASQGLDVVGVDRQQYDSDALQAARWFAIREGFPMSIVLADAAALPFANSRFDCVVCSNVIEHLDDIPGGLGELRRVLRPGGFLFVDFPLFRSPFGGHIDDAIRIPWFHLLPPAIVEGALARRGADRDIPVFRSLNRVTKMRFRRLVGEARLEVVATRHSYYITHPGRKLALSLLEALRRRSPGLLWRSLHAAVGDFTPVDLICFPLLLAAVPLSHIPALDELFTSGVNYVLRRPER
jgi:SAM-dependent methyltransferase